MYSKVIQFFIYIYIYIYIHTHIHFYNVQVIPPQQRIIQPGFSLLYFPTTSKCPVIPYSRYYKIFLSRAIKLFIAFIK